jgi:hypothetical protein
VYLPQGGDLIRELKKLTVTDSGAGLVVPQVEHSAPRPELLSRQSPE